MKKNILAVETTAAMPCLLEMLSHATRGTSDSMCVTDVLRGFKE